MAALQLPFAAACLVVAACLYLAPNAFAQWYYVNDTADSLDGVCDSQCSLRDAVAQGNANPGDDVIPMPLGNFRLDYGPLVIEGGGELEVEGSNARLDVIDAGGQSGVFVLEAGAEAELKRIGITGGAGVAQGGGVLVKAGAEAEIKQVDLRDNSADAGGGIFNLGELELEQAVVAGNTADGDGATTDGAGGGIYNAGVIEAENTTVTANKATGGFSSGARGGGIFQQGSSGEQSEYGSLTVSGNSAGSAGAGEGGGLFVGPSDPVELKGTIVAGNQSGQAGAENCSLAASLDETNNLESGTDCGFTAPGDKQNADPLLGPLQNNKGMTDTMAPASGSPALDSIQLSDCPGGDQRTVGRPQGPLCDFGAFEREVPAPAGGTSGPKGIASKLGLKLGGKRSQRVLRQRGVIVTAHCDAACNIAATGRISIGGASATVKLRKASKKLSAAGDAKLRLKLSKKSLASVRRALAAHRRVRATVSVRAADAAGVASNAGLKISLKR